MSYNAEVHKSSAGAVVKILVVTTQSTGATVAMSVNGKSVTPAKTGSAQYSGNVSIPAGEGPGVVPVVVTVRNGGAVSRYHLAVNWQHLEK